MAQAWIQYYPSGALLPLNESEHNAYTRDDCDNCVGQPIYPGSSDVVE